MTGSPARDLEPDHDDRVALTAELLTRQVRRAGDSRLSDRRGDRMVGALRARPTARSRHRDPPSRKHQNPPTQRQSLVDLLEAGLTVREIAERTAYSPSGILGPLPGSTARSSSAPATSAQRLVARTGLGHGCSPAVVTSSLFRTPPTIPMAFAASTSGRDSTPPSADDRTSTVHGCRAGPVPVRARS